MAALPSEPVRNVRFGGKGLEALEKADDPAYSAAIIKAFRLRMQTIRGVQDERDFYALKSLRYEKLKGKRSHQHSMRLNDQFRLILEYDGIRRDKTVVVVEIADYHD
jgi:proteic killer suppression protein